MMDRSRSWFDPRRLQALAARVRGGPAARPAPAPVAVAPVPVAVAPAPVAPVPVAPAPARAPSIAPPASAGSAEAMLERLRIELASRGELHGDLRRMADQLAERLGAERRRDHEAREQAEARLRRNHGAIMTLARSDSLSRGALDEALREITETAADILGVERSSVWVYNADQTAILCLELFQRTQGVHESGIELKADQFPAYFEALREERSIPAHDAHTDPRTREFSEVYLAPLSISSMLDAPIRVGGRMIGVICNEQVGPARTWTIEEEQFAGSLADFIALAMESNQRRETESQLRTMLHEYENMSG